MQLGDQLSGFHFWPGTRWGSDSSQTSAQDITSSDSRAVRVVATATEFLRSSILLAPVRTLVRFTSVDA